jgi:multiple sugar transport system permease protein
MATLTQPLARRKTKEFDSSERTLVSPIEMKRWNWKLIYLIVFLILLALSLTTLFPLYWLFTGAAKTPKEFLQMPPTLWPQDAHWDAFYLATKNWNFGKFFANTIFIAIGTWLLRTTVCTMAAYSLSKLKPAFKNGLLIFFFSTVAVPGAMLLIPRYLTVVYPPILYQLFGIKFIDSWWAIWLPYSVDGFLIFLLTNFFDQIHNDLIDAARIDGANTWAVFTRVVLPLSKPVLAVITITSFMGSWQDFFWPMLVLNTRTDLRPIMVLLSTISQGTNAAGTVKEAAGLNLILAGNAVIAIPPLIFFLIFQRQITRGFSMTGLTGE